MEFGWQRLSEDDLSRIARGIEKGRALGGPWHAEIHPTHRCNAQCFFCCTVLQRKGNESLPWDVLGPTLERAADRDLRCIRLSGGGESLLYPDMEKLLELCERRKLRFSNITTNGILLGRYARRFVEIGIDSFLISFNEPTPDLYARSMGTSEKAFHQILESIETVNAAREALALEKRPKLFLKFYVWKDNYRHLPEMRRLADALRADHLFLSTFRSFDTNLRLNAAQREEALRLLGEVIREDCASGRPRLLFDMHEEPGFQAFALNEQTRLLPDDPDAAPHFIWDRERTEYCYMPWYSVTITADGYVYPCCDFTGSPEKRLGNMLQEPLETVWDGPAARKMRKEFRDLVLLEGNMTHSPRLHRILEPMCTERWGCPFTFGLCSREFYREMAGKTRRLGLEPARARARGQDALIRLVHRLRSFRRKAEKQPESG